LIKSFSHLADERDQIENMLECMLPYDPTSPKTTYYKFCSAGGTTIVSKTILAFGEVKKIHALMLLIIAIRMVADVPDN